MRVSKNLSSLGIVRKPPGILASQSRFVAGIATLCPHGMHAWAVLHRKIDSGNFGLRLVSFENQKSSEIYKLFRGIIFARRAYCVGVQKSLFVSSA